MKTRRFDENNDPCYGHGNGDFITDHEAVVQNVETRIALNRGDWFLDETAGVPWFGDAGIIGSRASSGDGRAALKSEILETEGVTSLASFEYGYDRATRRQVFTATVLTEYDQSAIVEGEI